jgi:hypothetical protein
MFPRPATTWSEWKTKGKADRVQRIDKVLDRAYPLSYAALIGVVILLFF